MRTKTTKIKLVSLICALFLLPLGVLAQTTPVYVCGDNDITLIPNLNGYTLVNGDRVIWSKVGGDAVTLTYPTSPNFTPVDLTDGENKYTVQILPLSTAACAPDVSEEYAINKLPNFTIGIASNNGTFCTDATETSIVTATPSVTIPGTVSLDWTWTATDGTSNVAIADLGTANNGIFTMKNGIAPGTYIFTAKAKYNVGTGIIRPDVSCEVTSTTSASVTVTAVPDKPTISIQ